MNSDRSLKEPEKQELENHLIVTSTETNTQEDLNIYFNQAKEILI